MPILLDMVPPDPLDNGDAESTGDGLSAATLALLWADLGRDPAPGDLTLSAPARTPGAAGALTPVIRRVTEELGEQGTLLFLVPGAPRAADLAAWRNALWPAVHTIALYRAGANGLVRETLGGTHHLVGCPTLPGTILVGRPRGLVLSPQATVEKFDANAAGWSGDPSSPGYGHHRWMRRHVALFAPLPEPAHAGAPLRILDFGCGGGWVGIEAALAAQAARPQGHGGAIEFCAFDPSPEMVRLAEENARAAGVHSFTGRTGFGHAPPFPGEGEAPFDLVLSSGVVSFAPDADAWFDGLLATVRPGGTLVVADIHRDACGMRARRASKPLLPVRELNALSRAEALASLEARACEITACAGYQLTRPVPQLLHLNETRLSGLFSGPLLALNRLAAASHLSLAVPSQSSFDSWVISVVARV
jgi:SAM-dependent methyltransferase